MKKKKHDNYVLDKAAVAETNCGAVERLADPSPLNSHLLRLKSIITYVCVYI